MSPTKPRKRTPRQEAIAAETSAERLEELAADPKLPPWWPLIPASELNCCKNKKL